MIFRLTKCLIFQVGSMIYTLLWLSKDIFISFSGDCFYFFIDLKNCKLAFGKSSEWKYNLFTKRPYIGRHTHQGRSGCQIPELTLLCITIMSWFQSPMLSVYILAFKSSRALTAVGLSEKKWSNEFSSIWYAIRVYYRSRQPRKVACAHDYSLLQFQLHFRLEL